MSGSEVDAKLDEAEQRGASLIDRLDMLVSGLSLDEYQGYFAELREEQEFERHLLLEKFREAAAIGRRNRGETT